MCYNDELFVYNVLAEKLIIKKRNQVEQLALSMGNTL